jgi:hypothetical protein
MHVQGACCMLGGMTRMTISLCVILMETTNNIQCALLPALIDPADAASFSVLHCVSACYHAAACRRTTAT